MTPALLGCLPGRCISSGHSAVSFEASVKDEVASPCSELSGRLPSKPLHQCVYTCVLCVNNPLPPPNQCCGAGGGFYISSLYMESALRRQEDRMCETSLGYVARLKQKQKQTPTKNRKLTSEEGLPLFTFLLSILVLTFLLWRAPPWTKVLGSSKHITE